MRVAAELGLHSQYQIEQLFSLNPLSDRLPTNRGRDHSFYVRNIDPVSRDPVPIDIDQQTGLAKFAHHSEVGETGDIGQRILDLDRFVLEPAQVFTIDLDRQGTLEAGE